MSHQATIKRYTLIIEKVNGPFNPTFQEIQDYLFELGFEVSKRTIERDFEAIRNEFGVEITYNRVKRGYYIDEEKSVDITSFLRFLEIVNTAQLLVESLNESKETLDYISFDQGGGLKGVEQLKPILLAIKEHKKISFKHYNFHTEKQRKYTISPYLLKEFQNRWYIIGWVSGINELRTFGLDRISALEIKKDIFKPKPKLNPKERFNNTIGVVYNNQKTEKIILSFTPHQANYVKTLPLHSSQKIIIDNDTECRVSLDVVPNYELTQLIMKHNKEVKVVEPKWLEDQIKERLKKALEQYL